MTGIRVIEVMDTTLRDGEQTPGRSFDAKQKLALVEVLLKQLGVDRVEVTSALSSVGEQKMLNQVMHWASDHGFSDQIEILGFVGPKRGRKSVDWVAEVGGRVINLLCKGSRRHCNTEFSNLVKHLQGIKQTVEYAVSKGMKVNIYLEDWSQGMLNSPRYVQEMMVALGKLPIERVMLCDTLGVLAFWQVEQFVKQVSAWQPDIKLDIHCHDDYGLATANTLAAVRTGKVSGIHVTTNGLGERTGNASQAEAVVNIQDFLDSQVTMNVDESWLLTVSRMAALFAKRRVPANASVVGIHAFTDTAGVHAGGNRKGGLYAHSKLVAERFGAQAACAMGKLAGKASILTNAESLGFHLSNEEVGRVAGKVTEFGDAGKPVTIADLPYIIAMVLGWSEYNAFEVLSASSHSNLYGKADTLTTIRYRNRQYSISGQGDGGFDAFMNAIRHWAKRKKIIIPVLHDYDPTIPPGGGTGALVQAKAVWRNGKGTFETVGLNSDQTMAAILAAQAAINVCNVRHR